MGVKGSLYCKVKLQDFSSTTFLVFKERSHLSNIIWR